MYRDVSCKTDNDLENIFIVFIEKILSNEYINNCKGIQLTDDKKSLIDIKKNKKNKNKCCYII
jgi:hypothetical protein